MHVIFHNIAVFTAFFLSNVENIKILNSSQCILNDEGSSILILATIYSYELEIVLQLYNLLRTNIPGWLNFFFLNACIIIQA